MTGAIRTQHTTDCRPSPDTLLVCQYEVTRTVHLKLRVCVSENHDDRWLVMRASWEDLCISSSQSWAICSPPHCQGTFGSTKRYFYLLQLYGGGGGRCSYWHLVGPHQECCQIILQNTRNYLSPNISGVKSEELLYFMSFLWRLMVTKGRKVSYMTALPAYIVASTAFVHVRILGPASLRTWGKTFYL